MYVDLVFDRSAQTWMNLHVDAFEYFGGVPETVVPDNLKAAVVKCFFGLKDKPELNRSYRELGRHYDFMVDPTPPYAPEKKGKVESGTHAGMGHGKAALESTAEAGVHAMEAALAGEGVVGAGVATRARMRTPQSSVSSRRPTADHTPEAKARTARS